MSDEDIQKLTGVASFQFVYDGAVREVDNVAITQKGDGLIGMEMTKDGKTTHQIKSYKVEKISKLKQIEINRKDRP